MSIHTKLFQFTIYLSIFLFAPQINAQIKWVQGNIIIDDSDEVAEGVYVTNKRTNHTTRSNFTGTFFIQAQVNDTLIFRSDWFENRNIVLRPLLYKEKIVVHLATEVFQLKEAYISKKLTGILEKDVFVGKKENDVTRLYRLLKIDPDVNPMQDTSALKAGLLGGDISLTRLDVGRIFDAFSGNLRKRKSLIDYESKAYQIAQIRAYFGDNYFQVELNIPKYKINEFINTTLNNTNSTENFNKPNYFMLQNTFKEYSVKYLDDLFKLRVNKDYKPEIDEKELYIGVPLDSIPKN